MEELPKQYDPKAHEKEIYSLWENSGAFKPEVNPDGEPYSIIMPPPNANGSLHLGHAVFVTLEDIMTRFARMQGKAALWLPGADHAGFETQVVYEKKLEKQGKSRFKMERDELYRSMWEFTQENKKNMESQLKTLGASCDWDREKFTLDEDIVKLVNETFVKLYEDGLAYRDLRPVNWCTKHQTSLSDLEVKYEECQDPLYYIKYGPLTLATVRPETKFGDTAVAVNPNDPRYKKYIGQEIKIETVLGSAKIKVIADEMVDPKFGTGVVKITPAHDPNDFEVARKHDLEIKEVIDQYGRMNEKAGPYKGLKIAEARERVVEDMQKKGLIEKIDEKYTHTVGKCYKCSTTIEPRVLPQWFIAVNKKGEKTGKTLAKDAIEAVKSGKIKFVSKKFEKIFNHWMANIRDWNISRQIVWGIRIPAWYAPKAQLKDESEKLKVMGFAERVVPQVLAEKTKTYRIRDHELKIGDKVYFENSQTGDIFGYGIIDKSQTMKVRELPLQDKAHGAVYNNTDELIAAFKLHNPEKTISSETNAYIYGYSFVPKEKFENSDIENSLKIAKLKIKNSNSSEEIFVGLTPPGGEGWKQDEDVFDTWFSSGQWPFVALQAQSDSSSNLKSQISKFRNDFEKFYPTQVMETGWDILFFWVVRMIMLGCYMNDDVPFKTIYLHGLVRDKDRVKMSKSKGNVIDPLGVAEMYGTDAVRLALVFGTSAGNDIIISEEKIRGMRNFCNKLWNVARFVLTNTGIFNFQFSIFKELSNVQFSKEDKKDLAKLDEIVKTTTKYIENYRFSQAGELLHFYVWHEFADIIIEQSKDRLAGNNGKDKEAAQAKLLLILSTCLKLLHPFIPFVTETIWQQIPEKTRGEKMLISSHWPDDN